MVTQIKGVTLTPPYTTRMDSTPCSAAGGGPGQRDARPLGIDLGVDARPVAVERDPKGVDPRPGSGPTSVCSMTTPKPWLSHRMRADRLKAGMRAPAVRRRKE